MDQRRYGGFFLSAQTRHGYTFDIDDLAVARTMKTRCTTLRYAHARICWCWPGVVMWLEACSKADLAAR
jgi:hypothetical protein